MGFLPTARGTSVVCWVDFLGDGVGASFVSEASALGDEMDSASDHEDKWLRGAVAIGAVAMRCSECETQHGN